MEEMFWIREIKRGETRYLENLYQAYHGKIYALCFRFTRNTGDAEEQMQEIFMRVMAKIDRFEEKSSFGTWVYRLATNHLINFTKSRKGREDISLDDSHEEGAPPPDTETALVLRQAIAALPEGFRKVFILHDQEGLRHDEIGSILGISPGTSRSQLSRARVAMRALLQPLLTAEPCV